MNISVRVRGVNFDGTVELSDSVLQGELIEFQQGGLYRFKVKTETLEKDYSRYLVVKKLTELYEELTLNDQMSISEDG